MHYLLKNLKFYWVTLKKGGKESGSIPDLSSWTRLLQRGPRGSVLGAMLFDIYVNNIFFGLNELDICNFADDTGPYVCDSNWKSALKKVAHNSE